MLDFFWIVADVCHAHTKKIIPTKVGGGVCMMDDANLDECVVAWNECVDRWLVVFCVSEKKKRKFESEAS